ncbi:MAG: TIGR03986 family CRISPR-associated RAMP protein [Xanthobacteraceae bacterium]
MADRRTEFRQARRRFDRGTVELVSPYTFVPLVEPLPSCFGDGAPSHIRPEPDGLCGRLTVAWTFETPVLVGGVDEADGDKKKPARFATDAQGRPIIPGATIRGALRNVIEIATGSRMDIVDRDAHFAVRNSSDDYWRANSSLDVGRAMSFGWLVRTDPKGSFSERSYEGWSLRIAAEAWQIETTDILRSTLSKPDLVDFEALTVKKKYDLVRTAPGARIAYSTVAKPDTKRLEEPRKAVPAPSGKPGWIVFTGVDPNRTSADPKAKPKRYATVFGDEVFATIPLPADIVRRFIKIHATTPGGDREEGAWDFWCKSCQEKRLPAATDGTPMPGIPVFVVHAIPTRTGRDRDGKAHREADLDKYNHAARNRELQRILGLLQGRAAASHRRQSKPSEELYLGLSRFLKVPHRYGMDDMLKRDGHGEEGPLDFAGALFGHVPSEKLEPSGNQSFGPLKGRVFVGEATLDHVPKPQEYCVEIGTTMSPRASFWPYYLRPTGAARTNAGYPPFDYSSADARLAGWKRYPVRAGDPVAFPWDDRADQKWEEGAADPNNVTTAIEARMAFLPSGPARPKVFTGEIRFHNLLPAELGALLWALTWGAADGRDGRSSAQRHLIGRGKAQGYGRCVAQVTSLTVERNDGAAPADPPACVAGFKTHVTGAYFTKNPGAEGGTFDDVPMVRQLLAIADPRVGAGLDGRLVYPRHPFTPPMLPRAKALAGRRPPVLDRTASLEGYAAVKAAARQAAEEGDPPVHLPPYPDEPQG